MARLQCKDIPDQPILEFIWEYNHRARMWCNWYLENEGDVRQAMPLGPETPDKLVVAKMSRLIDRRLVDGCGCGCRGDYALTMKGCELIGRPWHGHNAYWRPPEPKQPPNLGIIGRPS